MKSEYLSIKQIAEQLGTTKQRVYRCIKKNCINEAHSEVVNGNTVLMYDNNAFIRISELLGTDNSTSKETHETLNEVHHDTVKETHETPNEAHIEALYDILKRELEAKNKQIADLTERLKEEQERLKEEQARLKEEQERLAELQASLKYEQNKNVLAQQKIYELEDKQNQAEEPAKKWWEFWK